MIGVVKNLTSLMPKANLLSMFHARLLGLFGLVVPVFILFGAMQLSESLTVDAGTALVLYINVPLLITSFNGLFGGWMSYKSSEPNIKALLDHESIPLEKSGTVKLASFESVATKGVTIVYSDEKKVKIPDMEIKNGEKVIFAGESGVGKSSLFNVLMGFNKDYEGTVLVNGIDIRTIELDSLRSVFGIAFQLMTVPTLPLEDAVWLGGGHSEERFAKILAQTNLEPVFRDKGSEVLRDQTLSGGERARISLAQAIAKEPDVLLMDETFSNVDEEMETDIIKRILEGLVDKTFICISHRMANAKYFDRVVQF